MKIRSDIDVIVIAGLWNKHIFNGEWVGKYLLPGQKLTVEVPLLISGSQRVSSKDVRIYVNNGRLNIVPVEITESNFNLIQSISLQIADYLPHTPVNSYGINFIFELEKNEIGYDIFKIPDLEKLKEHELKINKTMFKHTINIEDSDLNLSIEQGEQNFTFNFNFHYLISNLVSFKETIIAHPIRNLYNLSNQILKENYLKQ